MKKLTYVEEQEIINKPLKIAAFKEYYSKIKQYSTITKASRECKRSECILKVTPIDGSQTFFIIHRFDPNMSKVMHTGAVIGMWNELTVIGTPKKAF